MRYRYLGPCRAGVGGAIDAGDLVDGDHPLFRRDAKLLAALIARGDLVPIGEPEAAMIAPPENAMQRRPRVRRVG